METFVHENAFSIGIIVAGVLFAAVSAVVPEFTHYKMMFGVLLAGLLPYLVYGFAAAFLKPALSVAAGLTILAVHAGVVINERFTGNIDYSNGAIYYVPLFLAALLVPLLFMAARRPWHA